MRTAVRGLSVLAAAGLLVPLIGPAQNAQAAAYCFPRHSRHHADRHHEDRHHGHRRSGWQGSLVVHWPRPIVRTQIVVAEPEHQTVIVDGVTYHHYDGAFYKGAPAAVVPVPVPVAASGGAAPAQEILVVNVPNANGSFMPVRLQVAKDGTFIGPQGEVYPTKPDIAQLKAMYGR